MGIMPSEYKSPGRRLHKLHSRPNFLQKQRSYGSSNDAWPEHLFHHFNLIIPSSNLFPAFDSLGDRDGVAADTIASPRIIGYFGICGIWSNWTDFHIFDIEYSWEFDFGDDYGDEKVVYDVVERGMV